MQTGNLRIISLFCHANRSEFVWMVKCIILWISLSYAECNRIVNIISKSLSSYNSSDSSYASSTLNIVASVIGIRSSGRNYYYKTCFIMVLWLASFHVKALDIHMYISNNNCKIRIKKIINYVCKITLNKIIIVLST